MEQIRARQQQMAEKYKADQMKNLPPLPADANKTVTVPVAPAAKK